jgi:hypothetical protein
MDIWSATCGQKGCALEPITAQAPPTHCPVCGSPFTQAPERIAVDIPETLELPPLEDEDP